MRKGKALNLLRHAVEEGAAIALQRWESGERLRAQEEAKEKAEHERQVRKVRREYARDGYIYKLIRDEIANGGVFKGEILVTVGSGKSDEPIHLDALNRLPGLHARRGTCCDSHVIYAATHSVLLSWDVS